MPQVSAFVGIGVNDDDGGTVGSFDWTDGTLDRVSADDEQGFGNQSLQASAPSDALATSHYFRAPIGDVSSMPVNAVISGISVEIDRRGIGAGRDVKDSTIKLYKAGSAAFVGDNKAKTGIVWPVTGFETETYGDETDDWNTPGGWTRDEVVNELEIGLSISIEDGGPSVPSAFVDYIKITIHYTAGKSITVFAESAIDDNSIGDQPWLTTGLNTLSSAVSVDDGLWDASITGIAYFKAHATIAYTTHYLRAKAGDLSSIPGNAVITKILVELERAQTTDDKDVSDNLVKLYKAGITNAYVGDSMDKAGEWVALPGFTAEDQEIVTYTWDDSSWGSGWTRDEIVNDLHVGISAQGVAKTGNPAAAGIDYVKFTIEYIETTEFDASTDLSWTGTGSVSGGMVDFDASTALIWDGDAQLTGDRLLNSSTALGWFGSAQLSFDYDFKWCLFHNTEFQTTHESPQVFVEMNNTTDIPASLPTGVDFEGRILEQPRINEGEFDARVGLSGFETVSITADNADGLLNGIEIQDAYVRLTFVADGSAYKTVRGKVTSWRLGHRVTIDIEDIETVAFEQDLPKRITNTTDFPDAIDLEKPVPIVVGRNNRLQTLFVKKDDAAREYDYILGEGVGIDGNFKEILTVYRNNQALDNWSFTTVDNGLTNKVPLIADLRRPDEWYTYWWIFIKDGMHAGEIRYVTEYDSDLNAVTVDTAFSSIISQGTNIELREWRFYEGSQAAPDHQGYAFIRFKKFLHRNGSTDNINCDCDGLQGERNAVKFIRSILTNTTWGLGLTVDGTNFDNAVNDVDDLLVEGHITNTAKAIDWLREIMKFRDVTLTKGDGDIQVNVDKSRSPVMTLTHGESAPELPNIITQSPELTTVHPNQKVKNLKIRYRKDNRESSDAYFLETQRESSEVGVDTTEDWPLIYDRETADRVLDYRRKRLEAQCVQTSLDCGNMTRSIDRNDIVILNIPSLGVLNTFYEIVSASKIGAGAQQFSLVPYSNLVYSYEAGALPPEEGDITIPFFDETPPEPVTNLAVSMELNIVGLTAYPFALLTWSIPSDGNYGGAQVSVRETGSGNESWRSVGIHDQSARIEGLTPGLFYDFRVESLNITKELKGIAVAPDQIKINLLAGGDGTPPEPPSNLIGSVKLFQATWTWDKNSEADISHYIIEMYPTNSSAGSPLRREIIPHEDNADFSPHWEHNINGGDLTDQVSRWVQVAAVDHSGNQSGFTGLVEVETDSILQDDITDTEINGTWTNSVSSTQTLGSLTPVITVNLSGQRGGQVLDVDFTFTFDSTTASGLTSFLIQYNSSTIYNSGFSPITSGFMHIKTTTTSSAGSGTVKVYGAPGSPQRQLSSLELTVEERRR